MKPVLTPREASDLDRETQGRGVPAADLMERAVVSVDVTDDQEEVARKLARFDFLQPIPSHAGPVSAKISVIAWRSPAVR